MSARSGTDGTLAQPYRRRVIECSPKGIPNARKRRSWFAGFRSSGLLLRKGLEVGLRRAEHAHQAPHPGSGERPPEVAVEEVAARVRAAAGAADDLGVERLPRPGRTARELGGVG